MIRNIFIVLFLLVSFVGHSQTYRPLVKENAYWIGFNWYITGQGVSHVYPTEMLYFNCDTIVKGLVYSKLFAASNDSASIPNLSGKLSSLWREDSMRGVWMRPLFENSYPKESCHRLDTIDHEFMI